MTRTARRSLAASVATLSLLVLAGCGGDDGSASDEGSGSGTSSSASADAGASEDAGGSGEADTADVEAGEEISGEEFTKVIETALDDATTANVTVSSSLGGGIGGIEGTGQVDYDSDPAEIQMKAEIAQVGQFETILADGKLYLKGAIFGGGDKWVEVPLDDPNSPFGAIGDQLDPAAALSKLTEGIESATYVGEEDVDGDTLDHYTATVDTAVLLADLPPEAQGQSGLPETLSYDMWFDEDGLFRKFSVDMGEIGTSEGTFDDWGTDVEIEAPPADQVTTMPSTAG